MLNILKHGLILDGNLIHRFLKKQTEPQLKISSIKKNSPFQFKKNKQYQGKFV